MRLLTEEAGKKALEYVREHRDVRGVLQVLVSTRAYTGHVEPEWCEVDHVAVGDASVYPVKARMPERGLGQWSILEVLGVRATNTGEAVLPMELFNAGQLEGPAAEQAAG